MLLTERVVRVLYVEGAGLLVSDVVGRLHVLNEELEVVRSSPVTDYAHQLYAIEVSGNYVVGKDRLGTVSRWHLDTLELTHRLEAAETCDRESLMEGEEPSPVINRGIAIWNGLVYVNNGYRQLLVIDLATFTVLQIAESPAGDVPIEWICVDNPDRHAISDKAGRLFLGNLDGLEFPVRAQVDMGNLHRVAYDERHGRFWVTQEEGSDQALANGVIVLDVDGNVTDRLRFSRDDVEFLVFSHDYTLAYVGGFDGLLHILDNTEPSLKVFKTVEGFSHQLTDLTLAWDGTVCVLMQDGEIVLLDPIGEYRRSMGYKRQCVWDVVAVPGSKDHALVALDNGVSLVALHPDVSGVPSCSVIGQFSSTRGFHRRVLGLREGQFIALTRSGYVYRAHIDGRIVWEKRFSGLIHDMALSADHCRVSVATDQGGYELNVTDGECMRDPVTIDDGIPVWSTGYLVDGTVLFATREGVIEAHKNGRFEWRKDGAAEGEYFKRLKVYDDAILATGGGGARLITLDGQRQLGHYEELIDNTCENVVRHDGVIYAVSYGCQLLAFDEATGECVGLTEDLPDFTKGLLLRVTDSGTYVFAGCRGGTLSTYVVRRVGTEVVMTRARQFQFRGEAAIQRIVPVLEQVR